MSIVDKREKLIEENKKLYSWYWFYLNSETNLQYSRYPKAPKEIVDKSTGEVKTITIIPYLDYSKRFKEDRDKAFKINLEIRKNQEEINKLDKLIKSTR